MRLNRYKYAPTAAVECGLLVQLLRAVDRSRLRLSACLISLLAHLALVAGALYLVAVVHRAPPQLTFEIIAETAVAQFCQQNEERPLPIVITAGVSEFLPWEMQFAETAPAIDGPPAACPAKGQLRTCWDRHRTSDDLPAFRVLWLPAGRLSGGGIEGRQPDRRQQLLRAGGGSAAGQVALAHGLEWLVAHQEADGGWRFDHRHGRCQGRCGNPGSIRSTTAATALALLPLLGAGHSHREGDYAASVRRGIRFLQQQTRATPHGADLQDGTMYGQGLASLALCEAYAMTGDAQLGNEAQAALDFICYAQHSEGGWRYFPRQPGDTTVLAWQLAALRTGQMADLQVPPSVLLGARHFLDRVQNGQGAYYGYKAPGKELGPTAVGLLARMYLGWNRQHPALAEGVAFLQQQGPSATDMYFNYHAHQVLFHYGGHSWEAWNQKLQGHLIEQQARTGHAAGSWYFADRHGVVGGRLYNTAVCLLMLEVYYRYLPFYNVDSAPAEAMADSPSTVELRVARE